VSAPSELGCSTCGKRYRASAWTELPTVRILTWADMQEHVTAWPEEMVVAVRACSACGAAMARTSQRRMEPLRVGPA
jgi:hypothetical protein